MGYDMTITTGNTEAEQAALATLRPKLDDAVAERNKHQRGTEEEKAAQQEVDRLYDEFYSLPSEYFRLNIWGMGHCREFMLEREMMYASQCPEFPDMPYPEHDSFPSEDDFRNACELWEEKYEELSAPIKELHPEGGDTIPSHKLGSNDGWHVTEAECAAAVAAARASDGSIPTYLNKEEGVWEPVGWWEHWIDYLERASTRGGFLVY